VGPFDYNRSVRKISDILIDNPQPFSTLKTIAFPYSKKLTRESDLNRSMTKLRTSDPLNRSISHERQGVQIYDEHYWQNKA
jgi:hypothetical protein